MKIYRPLWNEGALLSPQQFQQQAEWESFRSAGVSALASPFPWGVEKVEFNDSLLSSGLIQITQLRLWLEEGSLIDAQRSDLPPPPRELDASLLAGLDAVTVVIALPHMQPGVINVEQEGIIPDRPLRYREEWVTLQDAFGSEDESMAVARFNFTIRFAHESNDSWKVCPVARLIRDGQNAWRVDPSFIPPVASFAASPILRERLVLLNRQLRSRRQRLMTMRRESNERLADFAVADVSLFWLLNALNSHARVLTEFERFPSRPPEQVWAELARLAGSMLTFSLDHDLDAIPGYDHEEPANAFPPLFDLIARLYGPGLRYIRETDTFIHWLDHCWVPAGVQILEYAKQTANAVLAEGQAMLASDDENIRKRGADQVAYANRLHSLSLMKAMLELLKPKVEIRTAELDSDPMLVRIKNGVIELKTQRYRENSRQDLITSVCPVEYDPKAACPAWERFIAEITCGDAELAAFLKRLVGYMLTGRTDEQLLFFFYGHGSNGKSTFIQIIQALMGSYATQINSDVLMANRSVGGPNASLAKLPGKRLVVANELPEGGRFDDMLIKSMTGGDTLVARQVYGKHEIEFTAQFSLVIIGNHKPAIHDMSHGMWRRMCLIPFAAQFSAEQADPTLAARLMAELPGIMNWALEGVAEWQQHGLKRSLPAAVVKANDDYREESDLLGEFLSGCILQPDAYTPATALYQAFQTFACEGNEWRMTQRVFNKKMAERGFTKLRRDNRAGFRGIALTADMPRVFESIALTV